jgi:hypothetical protein
VNAPHGLAAAQADASERVAVMAAFEDGPVDEPVDFVPPVEVDVTIDMIDAAARHLSRLRGRVGEVERRRAALVAFEVNRINAWAAREIGNTPTYADQTEAALVEMAERFLAGSKSKSVSTPWAKVKFRTTSKWLWPADDAELLAWAEKEVPGLVSTTVEKSVSKSTIKSLAVIKSDHVYVSDADGEFHLVPVSVEPRTTAVVELITPETGE